MRFAFFLTPFRAVSEVGQKEHFFEERHEKYHHPLFITY